MVRVRDLTRKSKSKQAKGLASTYLSEPKPPKSKARSATPENPQPKKKSKSHVQSAHNGINDLQSVEEFRHFLLENDSSFSNYIQNPLLLGLFDSHLMRENMISIMAQVLGNGQTKDSFFLLTRQAIQDTLSLFFVTRNI